jgi:diguanylate cyclase (GGDEF)-like protein/PAS domain S-box-containing protein
VGGDVADGLGQAGSDVPEVDPSRLWYTALHHLVDEVVFIHREDRSIAFVSPSVERVLGYTPAEFTQLSTPELIHPDDMPGAVEQAIKLRAEPGSSYRSTLRLRRADGSWVWTEIVGQNLLEVPEVQGLVQTLRDVSERRALEEQLLHQSRHDPLTGLANRRYFIEVLEAALDVEQPPPVAVVYFDLDGFKPINDALGHAAGDEVLREVATRLQRGLRARDVAARLGGDEFVALCYGVADVDAARITGERILSGVRGPFEVGGTSASIRASMGVAVAQPGWSADDVLGAADRALYSAKASGKDQVAVFGHS